MILCTLAGWTSIPLFLKFFSKDIDFWTANGWRYGFSALMWLPVLVWGWQRKSLPVGLWRAAFWPSVFNIGAQICFGAAPYYIEPGLMTFCLRFQIVFLTIGAMILFAPERKVITSPLYLVGIALVLMGTVSVLAFKPGDLFAAAKDAPGPAWIGIALAITSGALYAGYALCVRRFMHKMPAFTAFSAVSQYTGAALVVLMLFFAVGHGVGALHMPATPTLTSEQKFLLMLVSAIVGIGIGHTLYYASITRLGLAVSAGVVQLQPVTVSIGSMLLFDEKLTLVQWCSGGVAIGGAICMLIAQDRVAKAVKPEA
jgi:drug/metabolite transporter (DMT)-like permease